MQSKIIYTDNGIDKAITGEIQKEDDLFIIILNNNKNYRIGKKSIVCIKQSKGGYSGQKC